jgi:hypothetical protein
MELQTVMSALVLDTDNATTASVLVTENWTGLKNSPALKISHWT